MTIATTRKDFEQLITLRLAEAKLLMDHGAQWDGAYYLTGYVIEYAFKVRIISQLQKADTFPEKSLMEVYYKHDLIRLRKAAGLDDEMDNDSNASPHWLIVKDWSEQSRYVSGKTEHEARNLYNAIEKGLLPWIKARW